MTEAERKARCRKEITYGYVRDLLSKSTKVPRAAWPMSVVLLKQKELMLKRMLHER